SGAPSAGTPPPAAEGEEDERPASAGSGSAPSPPPVKVTAEATPRSEPGTRTPDAPKPGPVYRATAATDGTRAIQVDTPPEAGLSLTLTPSQAGEVEITLDPAAPEDPSLPALPYPVESRLDIHVAHRDGTPAPIRAATLTFQLQNERLARNDAAPEDVTLMHWNGAYWERLATEHVGTQEGVSTFQATTQSFSPFAVAITKARTADAQGPQGTEDGPAEGQGPPADLLVEVAPEALEDATRYTAQVDTVANRVQLVARDHAFNLTVDLPEPGTYTVHVRTQEGPPATVQDPRATLARYFELTLLDGEARPVEPDGALLVVPVDDETLAAHGADPSQLLVAKWSQHRWLPLPTETSPGHRGISVEGTLPGFSTYAMLLDQEAPEVGLQEPLPGQLSTPTQLDAVASDNIAVSLVELIVDGQAIASDEEHPYAFTLDPRTLAPGEHTVELVAHDHAGNQAVSTWSISIQEDEPLTPASQDPSTGEEESNETPVLGAWGYVLVLCALAGSARLRRRRST
ncbi:MAG: PGF-pre-PGF domain-containing protein, partial [Candidatus Thermoplasmatota archaeon]|nr:PGF-pre-PGF domain-containing protein [Candidatus Thermoplasmatota archaeon]